jgi:hypothetical protein
MKYVLLSIFVTGCSLLGGGKDEGGATPPKTRYEWVQGPVKHPVTGKHCSAGYCKDRPLKEGDSGCNSSAVACPIK